MRRSTQLADIAAFGALVVTGDAWCESVLIWSFNTSVLTTVIGILVPVPCGVGILCACTSLDSTCGYTYLKLYYV